MGLYAPRIHAHLPKLLDGATAKPAIMSWLLFFFGVHSSHRPPTQKGYWNRWVADSDELLCDLCVITEIHLLCFFFCVHQARRRPDCHSICPGMYVPCSSPPCRLCGFSMQSFDPNQFGNLVLAGSRQLAKCKKQLHSADKPPWSSQQVSRITVCSNRSPKH